MGASSNGHPREVGITEISMEFFTPPTTIMSAYVEYSSTTNVATVVYAASHFVSYGTTT